MSAPALIALAHGSGDPRTNYTIRNLVDLVRETRPGIRTEVAFLGGAEFEFQSVVDSLVAARQTEIVVVPLALGVTGMDDIPAAISEALARHPHIQIRATDDLGLGTVFLDVLDRRLRTAIRASRVRELDALVLAATGTNDPLVLQAVQRLARIWGQHHKLPVIAAYSSHVPPAANEAVRQLRAQGKRYVAVGSLFLAPGAELDHVTELALEAGAVAVSEPIGVDAEIAHLVLSRYAVGSLELVPV